MSKHQKGFTPTPYFLFMNNSATKKVFFNNRLLIGKRKVWGFTLFEMLVVIAIIGIIAALILVRYREGQKTYTLSQAAQILVSDLRQAQTMAITGADVKKPDGTDYPSIGGYGIYINDANSYYLFLNTNSDPLNGCPQGAVPEVILKTVNFSSGITIDNTASNVFFAPPSPKTCINNTSQNSIPYTLTQTSNGNTTTVTVDKYGKIDVQ
ncbi:MAG: hypothetical protein AUJ32_03065 [Parcubacteria group bacterium CG1_02_40_82]|uniref:General secretion pathway GspH domain-containing protein n=4 Tax=Candidatus Portnoyibacteriota TaxID=1817913 RepID=A0A2M7IHT3_9BACT|nr:MAG: hypothetical protein AUJ32_03065 [Parcubacteria group bacterium CG1_02_40_82]PIQ75600.1 MAG: hypothetical protein COV84_00355 [Candidatus Portnoybacteria bacterium CG11_big_fil_rev_8_21_14_0_20_40_15]PIS31223.1 MAG: hypothetical protein COT41_02345 [Candidatus Portnoybacteria bacterium CG08_land_8_20_14_0_20_40_83]PIW76041.1 MAG: hypothetical protein CO001_03415 [Candidatus Portnoybacteria bacterium CG_4_8_14_3_um_filter_40_10]PIY75332.1 MAG: hypothetical protein COY85_00485 [Candidatus